MIHVRPAMRLDTGSMASLLNEIIKIGGTTALVRPVTGDDLTEWMAVAPDSSAWHVALTESEQVVGFQWITPSDQLPRSRRDRNLCSGWSNGAGHRIGIV